eukprot:gene25829-11505_t
MQRSKAGRERPGSSSGRPQKERPGSAAPREAPPEAPPPENEGEEQQAPPSEGKAPKSVGRSLEELLVDKLMLLDYVRDFCKRKKNQKKPLNRQFFATTKNQKKPLNRQFFATSSSDNQFFYFTSLVSWLLGLAGVELKEAKEFDDPGVTCNNILAALKKLGFASPSVCSLSATDRGATPR